MDPRLQRLKRLFEAALALPREKREALLSASRTSEPELCDRVREMLAIAEGQTERAPTSSAASAAAAPPSEPPPTGAAAPESLAKEAPSAPIEDGETIGSWLGPFRLEEQLGEGGFGVVFRAQQERPVRREVAVKILKLGMDTREVVARFELERQALALMDHPHIARVIDAGATPKGRPFFAMELVRGEPITRYCDTRKLGLAARLELFTQVCTAVQHAHSKGLIHRDLKPSNLLVGEQDGRPVVKVIDFGIAKATSGQLTDRSVQTEFRQIIGTLQYMSPEQAQGSLDIDTRSDIYALGVILYEMLTGSTPLDAKVLSKAMIHDLQRIISQTEPPRPSTRLRQTTANLAQIAAQRGSPPERLRVALSGELDWITMKALEKDRARRYESAAELGADLRRYLSGEPVLAAPPSTAYRVRKFVARHRGKVLAAALLALALIGGIIGTSVGLVRAESARDAEARQRRIADEAAARERVERQRAEQVAVVLESVFDGIDPEIGEEVGLDFKEQLLERVNELATSLSRLEGDPQVHARMQLAFGRTALSLSEYARAVELFTAARETLQRTFGPEDPRTRAATLSLCGALQQRGMPAQALALLEEEKARALSRVPPDPREIADLEHYLGMLHIALDDSVLALRALEAARQSIDITNDDDDALLLLHNLGVAHRNAGRRAEAIVFLEDALARRERLFGPASSQALMSGNSLSLAYAEAGRIPDAIRLEERFLEQILQHYPPNHMSVLNLRGNLAVNLGRAGRVQEEIAMLEDIRGKLLAATGEDSGYSLKFAHSLALAYQRARRPEEALKTIDAALGSARRLFGERHVRVLHLQLEKARILSEQSRWTDALAEIEQALVISREDLGPEHVDTLALREHAGWCLRDAKKPTEAIEHFEAVARTRETRLGPDHPQTLNALRGLGCSLYSAARSSEAIPLFEALLPRVRACFGAEDMTTLGLQTNLGSAYEAQKRYDEGIRILEDTLPVQERLLGPAHEETLSTASNLLGCYEGAGRKDESFELRAKWVPHWIREGRSGDATADPRIAIFLREAETRGRRADAAAVLQTLYEGLRDQRGADDPRTLLFLNNYASALWSAGAYDRSGPLFEELLERSKRALGPSAPDTLLYTGSAARNWIDAGKPELAASALEEALKLARNGQGRLPGKLEFLARELAAARLALGELEAARASARELIANARARLPRISTELASVLVHGANVLVDAEGAAEAEPALRDALTIRERAEPQAWTTANSRVLLGAAISAQGRFAEAEPHLISGAEALIAHESGMPLAARKRVREAAARVVAHYDAWLAVEPSAERMAARDAWKKRLEERSS